MAFASPQQFLHLSFFTSDCQGRLLGYERLLSSGDRVTCLRKDNKGVSSSSQSFTTPKALRENLPSSPSSSSYHHAFITFDAESDTTLSPAAMSDIEDLFMELRRSLLESQWALSSENEPISSTTTLEVEDVGTLGFKSGKRSARERRIEARKKGAGKADERSMAAMSTSSKGERWRKQISIEKSLESVSTIGLLKNKGKRELLTKEEEVVLSKKMKVGQNLKAARRKLTEVLGYEPSDELWASSLKLSFREVQSKIQEADRARDKMFVSNLRLVVSVAHKYCGIGVSLSDLVQEGSLGLLRGLEKFDHTKGFKLSTYVHWWIRQGITRSLAEHSRTVRIPAHMLERINHVNKAAALLRREGEEVSVQNISKALNMTDEMITVALKATKRTISLDKTKRWGGFNYNNDSMHNYIADPRLDNDPWDRVDRTSLRGDIDAVLGTLLGKRERDVLRLHYGLDCSEGRGLSLERISHRFGISRERTRQVEKCALRKLAASGQVKDLEYPSIK